MAWQRRMQEQEQECQSGDGRWGKQRLEIERSIETWKAMPPSVLLQVKRRREMYLGCPMSVFGDIKSLTEVHLLNPEPTVEGHLFCGLTLLLLDAPASGQTACCVWPFGSFPNMSARSSAV